MAPAVLREHQRILAAYGGVYNDPKLQAALEQTVERLVAASEKPDRHYKVTILNSQSINAFALPTGHIYVTRGLIALANDEFELASVLAHEMGHVIARHAEQREEEARNADIASRTITDLVSDPEVGALALAKSKLKLASFSRSQEFEADALGIGIAARAGYDPYGAVRFLTSMEHNSELKAEQTGPSIRRRRTFCRRIRRRLNASPMRLPMPASIAPLPPIRRSSSPMPRRPTSLISTALYSARIRAKALCAAGGSCIRSSASPSPRRKDLRSTTRRRRCSGSSAAAARRFAWTLCAYPPSRRWPPISPPAGSRISTRQP